MRDGHGYVRTITFRIPQDAEIDPGHDLDLLVELYEEEGGAPLESTVAFRQPTATSHGIWSPPYMAETDERTGY